MAEVSWSVAGLQRKLTPASFQIPWPFYYAMWSLNSEAQWLWGGGGEAPESERPVSGSRLCHLTNSPGDLGQVVSIPQDSISVLMKEMSKKYLPGLT